MRSRFFGNKKFKSLFLIAFSALLILSAVFNVVKFTTPVSAISLTDAESVCNQLGGQFLDNSQSAGAQNGSDDAAKCSQIPNASSDPNKRTTCEDSGGTFSPNTQTCNWHNVDEVTVTHKASELKALCESVEGTTFTNASTQGFATCHDLPPTTCQANGGTNIAGICKWTNVIDDLSNPEQGQQEPQTEATCHSTSGAVGWFVCPILELASSASVWAYENVIQPSLVLRSSLFNMEGSDNGTYQAWSVFRNIANIVFVILLLFVIFSQVTGLGIDNYGIKKTLPKLIVAAVLVNISFIICQLLIDISNIAGAGVYNILNDIEITVPESATGGIGFNTSIIFTVCAAIAGTAALATAAGSFWGMISGALLAVLPALIGALVGIFLLFFLLAMRQAIVVLLVAISPLAFVCYTLPNTKNLFDRWAQLMRGMLVLYPICAVMIAGGRMASKIILASGAAENNLFIILVAMVAEAGPLFLIPGLTRSAYRATGQLGTALNGLRGRLTGGARGLVRNNQSYQNAQARNQRRRITATTGRTQRRINAYNTSAAKAAGDRNLRDRWRLRAGNQERVAGINEQVLAAEEQQRKINRMSDATEIAGMRAQQGIAAQQQSVRNADYADANFANAVITQAEIEHDASRDRQMLYSRDEYTASRRNANNAVLSNEITKMYSDQYAHMNTGELLKQFDAILKAPAGTEHHAEQFSAAFSTLAASGQLDKAREVIHNNADNVNDAMQNDAEFRTRAMQQFGSSGDMIMQEYAKHIGTKDNPADIKDFATWANDTSDEKNSSLRASISEKGLDRVDKDGFDFLAKNAQQALAGATNENIAKVAASTTDAATVGKLVDAISTLDASRRGEIMKATSGAQFVSMNENVRVALSGGGAAGDAAWKKAVGDALAADPQLRGRLTAAEQGRYVGASSTPQGGSQRIVIDHSTSGRPTDENGRTIPFPGPNNGR